MKKQELIKHIEDLPYKEGPIADTITINRNWILESIEQLDESETGHADEAPRYVKNILARLRELPLHDREVWLKAIMSEFERDFSHAIWREGYGQGKFEGMLEREKVKIPEFAADVIEGARGHSAELEDALHYTWCNGTKEFTEWYRKKSNRDLFARAWLDGYEVEEEKQYLVKIRATKHYLAKDGNRKIYFSLAYKSCFTKKELEEANFGWVFDCPGIEIEEVL